MGRSGHRRQPVAGAGSGGLTAWLRGEIEVYAVRPAHSPGDDCRSVCQRCSCVCSFAQEARAKQCIVALQDITRRHEDERRIRAPVAAVCRPLSAHNQAIVTEC